MAGKETKKKSAKSEKDPYTSSLTTPLRKHMEKGIGPDNADMSQACRDNIHCGPPGKKPPSPRKKG